MEIGRKVVSFSFLTFIHASVQEISSTLNSREGDVIIIGGLSISVGDFLQPRLRSIKNATTKGKSKMDLCIFISLSNILFFIAKVNIS